MASDLFSLSWDDFHQNMSVGMNSLLKSEDLVDVTIAVEGRYLKAHKMVLSVCSPYFRELFKVTPCKHPIVFLKDVSYVAMSDLLKFMYQGEVQVSQENLTTFIKTGEALQIKGLTDHGNGLSECDKGPDKEKNKSVTESEETTPTSVIKTEPVMVAASTSSVEQMIQFKEEPCDLDDFNDDPFDNTNEDYSMMEGVDEEPEAGTSAVGTAGGQEEMSSGQENTVCTPPEIRKEANQIQNDKLLPEKSKEFYIKVYSQFKDWCKEKNVAEVSENVLLDYFQERAEKRKASSLWATFSMLKQTLRLKENVDIARYYKVIAFLKRRSVLYTPKKTAAFDGHQITKFIVEAPDEVFLPTKVILIIGISGACRTEELTNMLTTDVDVREDIIVVHIPQTETKSARKFVIMEPIWIDVIKKYLAKRPSPDLPRLFIGFRGGKPTRQNMGHNTISKAPYKVAKYLQLPNVNEYTGHTFRRTSAIISSLKRYGGWKSSTVVEGH